MLLCQFANVPEERSENSLPAKLLFDIDTLNPPEISVAPIAPFAGDEQLAGGPAADLREEISSFGQVVQQRGDSGGHASRVKFAAFSFERDARIEVRDDCDVGERGLSNFDFDAAMISSACRESI